MNLRPLALLTLLLAMPVAAQDAPTGDRIYSPEPGEKGKDVPWVPTPEARVKALLEAAGLTRRDRHIDLGSGDGQWVIVAARDFGVRSHGIEYNPDLVALAKRKAKRAGLASRATFAQGDVFETDFSTATVLSLYLLPEINLKLRPKIFALAPGTRIVSHCFDMGDWPADRTLPHEDCYGYLWIVPARVAGRWAFSIGPEQFDVDLDQRFQAVAPAGPLGAGRLEGAKIRFERSGAQPLTGMVGAGTMAGEGWSARRLDPAP